ncbi:10856_t:CDS:1, partial [Dentiscutata heterogama]
IGIEEENLRFIFETAIEFWKKLGGEKASTEILIAQMQSYMLFQKP